MKRIKVLLIGDDDGMKSLQHQLLQHFHVKRMSDLDDVHGSLDRYVPDLLLVQYAFAESKAKAGRIKDLRNEQPLMPIIALCADDEWARIAALNSGADDAMGFGSIKELIARIERISSRTRELVRPNGLSCIRSARIEIDLVRHRVYCDGKAVSKVQGAEYRLLCRLVGSPGRIFPRELLVQCLKHPDRIKDLRTIDVHVGRIRKALGDSNLTIVRTARGGEGYFVRASRITDPGTRKEPRGTPRG